MEKREILEVEPWMFNPNRNPVTGEVKVRDTKIDITKEIKKSDLDINCIKFPDDFFGMRLFVVFSPALSRDELGMFSELIRRVYTVQDGLLKHICDFQYCKRNYSSILISPNKIIIYLYNDDKFTGIEKGYKLCDLEHNIYDIRNPIIEGFDIKGFTKQEV